MTSEQIGNTDIDAQARARILGCQINLLTHHKSANIGFVSFMMPLVNADVTCETIQTDGKNLYYNSEFVMQTSVYECRDLLESVLNTTTNSLSVDELIKHYTESTDIESSDLLELYKLVISRLNELRNAVNDKTNPEENTTELMENFFEYVLDKFETKMVILTYYMAMNHFKLPMYRAQKTFSQFFTQYGKLINHGFNIAKIMNH